MENKNYFQMTFSRCASVSNTDVTERQTDIFLLYMELMIFVPTVDPKVLQWVLSASP